MNTITVDDLLALAEEAKRYAQENSALYVQDLTPEQATELFRVYSARAFTAGLLVMIALSGAQGLPIALLLSSTLQLGLEADLTSAVKLTELPANPPVVH